MFGIDSDLFILYGIVSLTTREIDYSAEDGFAIGNIYIRSDGNTYILTDIKDHEPINIGIKDYEIYISSHFMIDDKFDFFEPEKSDVFELDLFTIYNILLTRQKKLDLPVNFAKKTIINTFYSKLNKLNEMTPLELSKIFAYVYLNAKMFKIDTDNIAFDKDIITVSNNVGKIISENPIRVMIERIGTYNPFEGEFKSNEGYILLINKFLGILLPKLEQKLLNIDNSYVMSPELEKLYGIETHYIMC